MKSMTGYGRAREEKNGRTITVELRAVNHRYLDCTVKAPRQYGFLDDAVKKAAAARRMVEDNNRELEKYDGLARKALQAGNEDDARVFLSKKQQLAEKAASLQATFDAAHANAEKMRQMHDKLVGDIESLNARREMIKAKVAVAKTQQKVNEYASSADKAAGAMDAFSRMEAKADAMLDKANAMADLNEPPKDEAASLEEKYQASAASSAVDEELAKLKKEMGL